VAAVVAGQEVAVAVAVRKSTVYSQQSAILDRT